MKATQDWMAFGRSFAERALADPRFANNIIAVGAILLAVAVAWFIARRVLAITAGHALCVTGLPWLDGAIDVVARQARELLAWITFTATVGTVFLGIAYHAAGRDVLADAQEGYARLTPEQVWLLTILGSKLLAVAVVAKLAMSLAHRLRTRCEGVVRAWIVDDDEREAAASQWFRLAEVYAQTIVALAAAQVASDLMGLGGYSQPAIIFLVRAATILAVARLVAIALRCCLPPLVEMADRRLANTFFRHYWERISRLAPLAEKCAEWAIYVAGATLLVDALWHSELVTEYGPRVVACIGIFFGARVCIELGQVMLHEALGLHGANARDQKRQTLALLLYSCLQYAVYFGAGVMMLGTMNLSITPFLAGISIAGMVLGLGAQSLVSDMVAGLFILLDSQFLVGDHVEIGSAKGVVEAIAVRHTQLRDDNGKLHIIPNGQIKEVISASKGYVNAVVNLKVPLTSDIDGVLRAMGETGQRLRKSNRDVLADTVVQGVVEMNLQEVTVRAITKVKCGCHATVETEFRRLLKQALDDQRASVPMARAA